MVKKVLCALLAFCLLFAVMPRNTALAADEAQIVVGSANAKPGEDVTVSVSFKNNPGIIAFRISVVYDSNKLELKEANTAEGSFASASFGPLTANPFSILWDESTSPDVSGDATAATLTFGVKDSAAAGDSAISVTYEDGNIYNYRRVPNIANTFPRGEIRFFKLFFAAIGKYRVNSSKIRISKGS